MDQPSLGWAILFALLAAGCFTVVWFTENTPLWLRAFAIMAGVVFITFAAVLAFTWLRYHSAEVYARNQEASVITETLKLADKIGRMEAHQVTAWLAVYPEQAAQENVTRIVIETSDGKQGDFMSIPLSEEKLQAVASWVTGGAPFTVAGLTGSGKPLSRGEFEQLKLYMLSKDLVSWANPNAHEQGLVFSPSGKTLVKTYAEQG